VPFCGQRVHVVEDLQRRRSHQTEASNVQNVEKAGLVSPWALVLQAKATESDGGIIGDSLKDFKLLNRLVHPDQEWQPKHLRGR
jgi:hypothetical protein